MKRHISVARRYDVTLRYHGVMVRTQIQLRRDQYEELKRRAAAEDRSLADLVRESVDSWLSLASRPDPLAGLRQLSGVFRDPSGARDVAEKHDRYLAEQAGP